MGCASSYRPTKKEVVLMRNENRALVNRRSLLALLMILAGVIALTILATVVVGWFSTYVVPLAVLLVVAAVVLWLLMQLVKELPKGHDISDWWQ
jgi:fatty acid desaturase